MSKQLLYPGEIIGLAVMLLMVVALVAAQADASVPGSEAPGDRPPVALVAEPAEIEPSARLRAVIDLEALTIAIDASLILGGSLVRGN